MILFTITDKKEQAINLREKYFHSDDTFYNKKEKGTSNNLAQE